MLSSPILCCLWVRYEASVSPDQISTFSNIYRHTSTLPTKCNLILSSTKLYWPSTTMYQCHLMRQAQYTWSSFFFNCLVEQEWWWGPDVVFYVCICICVSVYFHIYTNTLRLLSGARMMMGHRCWRPQEPASVLRICPSREHQRVFSINTNTNGIGKIQLGKHTYWICEIRNKWNASYIPKKSIVKWFHIKHENTQNKSTT